MLMRAVRMPARLFSAAFAAALTRQELAHSIPCGENVDYAGKRVCLFSHFDKDNVLDDHVAHYLKCLADTGLNIVLITSCSKLDDDSMAKARQVCTSVIVRDNVGYDFAGWALAMSRLLGIFEAEQIVCANDSVYAPLHPLAPMFADMKDRGTDVWGATQSHQVQWHVQSYFLVFTATVVSSPFFKSFWAGIRALDKDSVIDRYETKLASIFVKKGFSVDSYLPAMGDLKNNPTLDAWREILAKKSPFLKVQLLRDNPKNADLSGWKALVASTGFDLSLISRHLARVETTRIDDAAPAAEHDNQDFYVPRDSTLRLRAGMLSPSRA